MPDEPIQTPESLPESEPTDALPPATGGLASTRPSLRQLALGGALLVTENVNNRLVVDEAAAEAPARTLDAVLRPAAEWDRAPDPVRTARHLAIGMLDDARERSVSGGRFLNVTTDALGRGLDRLSRPVRRSALLRPLRRRFHRYQDHGERVIGGWIERGRAEEARSRVVAERSLNQFVSRSVTDLTESPEVQVLVQQVVESQSTGLIGEALEEVRERGVSLDVLVDRRARRLIGRPPVESLSPPFRPRYLQMRPALLATPLADRTLAGNYAGFATRFAAFLIDVVLLIVTLSLATTFVNAFINLFNLEGLVQQLVESGALASAIIGLTTALAGTLLVVFYGFVSWSLNGQTIGDFLLGVRVVRAADGGRVSPGRAGLRIIGCYVAGLPLFLGFLWALFDARHQGWHDKLAGTVVVYDWPAVPDEVFLRDELAVTAVLPRQRRMM